MINAPLRLALLQLGVLLALPSCKPPAADDYVERVSLAEAGGSAGQPLAPPDVSGAVWVPAIGAARIVYGIPGQKPLLTLACENPTGAAPQIRITRVVPADPRAKALFALIGNGHIARLPVDAVWNGRAWVWQGLLAADEPQWDVLTGPRQVSATLPGAGQLDLNPSPLPGQLIETCRLPASDGEAPLAE